MAEKTKKTTGHPLKPLDAARTAGRSAIAASTEFSTAIDPSITRIAVELLRPEFHASDAAIQGGLQSLRELLSVDAVVVALFDDEMQVVQQTLASCTSRVGFTPALLLNEPIPGRRVLLERLGRQRLMEIRDLARPRNDHSELASCFARFNFGAILVAGIALRDRLAGFILIASARARSSWEVDAHLVLKLIAANYSAGLERMRLGKEFAYLQLRNELAMQSAHDGLWDYDLERNTLYLSPRWKAMLGYATDELIDVSDWRQFVHPDDAEQVESLLRAHLADELEYFESTHRVRHRSGEWRWVTARAKALTDENGRLIRLVGVELDITENKLFEEALFREKESAQITLQSIGDGVITTDASGQVEYLNPVAESLTGWKLEDAIGRVIDEVFRGFHEETCEPLENPLIVAMRRCHSVKSVRPVLLIRRDGNELYIESNASPIRDGAGAVSGGVLVFHDVSESRELNRKLSYHASHDILTGLVNRREFESRLAHALKTARAREGSCAMCYLDLDQFKIINDNCGHNAGDSLLGQVGALLKSKVGWRDTVARLGGDEFGILFEACSMEDAMHMAESIREAVREYRFNWEERTFRLGVSIGVVPITADNDDVAGILSAADSACAAAKEAGRNRIYSFQENDLDLMRRRREMQWAARINNALEEGRFEIFRQMIQPLQRHEPGLHYELLLRMRDEQGKIIAPDQFIAAAERYGITPSIDRWVIENAFRWLVSEADEREKLTMCSINLSGQSLGDDKFLPFVIDQFHRSGIDGRKICFEITETAAVASFSQANRFIQALKELGCRFALDDFGTGLSSFGYLKHFPVDFLKIDGSFVKDLLHDPIDREMVRSINEIGHLTGKLTIAEFAENPELIDMLRSIGVDYAQGYGVAMPQRVLKVLNA
ncbi:MAG TPA: EAL domain-containing protein [Steroidobacteraceae bacterium]|nr:EAL domain-containing protein [Steroidobacteraceae bacterium]